MTKSYVQLNDKGLVTSYVGPDATSLFAAITVRNAMKLYLDCGIKASRTYTVKNMTRAASVYTQKAYPASKKGLELASEDLQTWILAMQAAIPVLTKE